jgi:Ca-activated chloride channel homolog
VSRWVTERGGYVESRKSEDTGSATVDVTMTLRVPAAVLDGALAELRKQGAVLSEAQTGRDVTDEVIDTDAELRAKRKVEERLLGIVQSAGGVKDLLAVEEELGRVRTDIERLDGRSRTLASEVAFATIHVSLVSPVRPVVASAESVWSRFARAFGESGRLSLEVLAGMIVLVGAVAPLAVPVLLVALAVATIRRRRAARVGMLGSA